MRGFFALPDGGLGRGVVVLHAWWGLTDLFKEVCDRLAAAGLPTDFMRLRALPINDEVKQFVADHDHVYVVELNRDGQLHGILVTEMPEIAGKLRSIAYLDGMPMTARWLVAAVEAAEAK